MEAIAFAPGKKMRAIAFEPGSKKTRLVERAEPDITAPDEIKMKIVRVGICGTDREKASEGKFKLPQGQNDLVIGHEMLGQVVDVGDKVTRVKPGDFGVFTVRRGCGKCVPCSINRSDMCKTGDYTERGLRELDGYLSEYVVDKEEYVVYVPPKLADTGVLCEPFSVVEKAIDEIMKIQLVRLPGASITPDWIYGKRCLVTGLGPIGLLAALALRLRGAEVYGLDIVDEGSSRPKWLEGIDGKYFDGRRIEPDKLDDILGPMDVIFEASGVPGLAFNILDALANNGIYVFTGLPTKEYTIKIQGGELMEQIVHGNQIIMGSVNASRDHFRMAVDDLERAYFKWSDHAARLITHRRSFSDFDNVLEEHPKEEIKLTIEWK